VGAVDYRVNNQRRKAMRNAALNVPCHGAAAAYCLTTLHQPNRHLMLAAYIGGMAVGIVGFWAARRMTPKALGSSFSFILLLASIVAVALGAYWDGGAGSPVTVGFVCSAAFVASSTPRLYLMVGFEAVIIGLYLFVAATGEPARPGYVFLYIAGMIAVIMVCARQAHVLTRQRSQLRSLAELDPLTGALNRRGLAKLAEQLFTDTPGFGPSVVCLDLDGFKLVNDRLGHATGDELLKWTVATVRDVLRTGDTIVRTGGDEFVIVLVDADEATARAVAGRIGEAVGKRTGVSIGSATAPRDGDTLETLIEAADQRLYRDKQDHHGTARLSGGQA
jgi:diguanylate cyclase (GGDEF)-like protein